MSDTNGGSQSSFALPESYIQSIRQEMYDSQRRSDALWDAIRITPTPVIPNHEPLSWSHPISVNPVSQGISVEFDARSGQYNYTYADIASSSQAQSIPTQSKPTEQEIKVDNLLDHEIGYLIKNPHVATRIFGDNFIGDNFKFFNNFVEYIGFVQTQQSVDLGAARLSDFPSTFAAKDSSIFSSIKKVGCVNPLNKRNINVEIEKFLAFQALTKPAIESGESFKMPDAILEMIKRDSLDRIKRHVSNLVSKEKDYVNAINNNIEENNSWWVKIREGRDNIDALQGNNDGSNKIILGIEAVGKDNFWKFIEYSRDGVLKFETSQPITLRHVVPTAGINLSSTLGKFFVCFKISNSSIKLYPSSTTQNVRTPGGYYHPHISTDHLMCYGNASDTITRAIQSFDIETIFRIIKSILTTYNPESPYNSLLTFVQAQERKTNARIEAGTASESPDADIEEEFEFEPEGDVEEEEEEDAEE